MSPEPGRHIVVGAAIVSAGHASVGLPVQLSSGSHRSPEPVRHVVVAEATVSAGHASPATPLQLSAGSQISPEPGLQIVVAEAIHVCRTRLIRIDPYSSHPGHIGHPNPYDTSSLPRPPYPPDTHPPRYTATALRRVTDIARTRRCRSSLPSATTSVGHDSSALTRTALIRVTDRSPEPVRHVVVAAGHRVRRTRIAGITPLQLSAGSQISPEPGVADRRCGVPPRLSDTTHPD